MSKSLIALAIVAGGVVLLSPVACTMHRQRLISEAISRPGADPIAVKCAIEGTDGTGSVNAMCLMKAAK